MTKREAMVQLRAEDFRLLADAAAAGQAKVAGLSTKDSRRLTRAVKILRSVKAAK